MTVAIKVQNLHKKYGETYVLKGISFEVKQGEIVAILGANGAGKTTTLECIEGLRGYDSGNIAIHGKFGVQLQSTSLPDNMKVLEALTLFAKWNKAKIDLGFMKRIDLDAIKQKQYHTLSTGQKRKLHLALALIGNPDIVFLDEPTAGLDVEGRIALHAEIKLLKEQGKTIVLASHDMAEVESLCDRIAILKDGLIAFIGSPQELTVQSKSSYHIGVKFSQPIVLDDLLVTHEIENHQGYRVFEAKNIEDGLLELITCTKRANVQILDLNIDHANLEQRFMEIAKENG